MDVSNASLLSSSDNTAKSGIIIGCNLQWKKKKNWNFLHRTWIIGENGKIGDLEPTIWHLKIIGKKFFQWCEFQICPQKLSRPYNKSRIFLPFTQNGLRGRVLEMSWLATKIKCYLHNSSGGTNLSLQVCII